MRKLLILILIWIYSTSLDAQVKHPDNKRNGYTANQIIDDVVAIQEINSNIKKVESLGYSQAHFVFLMTDKKGYFLDLVIYNFMTERRNNNVYWCERDNIRVQYPDGKDFKRKIDRIVTYTDKRYEIHMKDSTVIKISYEKTTEDIVFKITDSANGGFAEGKRGLFIDSKETSVN